MGTEVDCKSYLPGYYYMTNLNEDSSGGSWPLFYGDKALPNGQYYNAFMPRIVADAYPAYDKNALKQKILEHEAIFKDQVFELHRLYKRQRDMMEEIQRKELLQQRLSIDTSSSSGLFASQIPSEDARKWNIHSFQIANSGYARPSTSVADVITSSSNTKGNGNQAGLFTSLNSYISKESELPEPRPSKVRKLKFDLQLPADVYIDTEEREKFQDKNMSELPNCPASRNYNVAPEKLFIGGGGGGSGSVKPACKGDASRACAHLKNSVGLADLNEPVQVEEFTVSTSVNFQGHSTCNGEIGGLDLSAKCKSEFPDFSAEKWKSCGKNNGTLNGIYANRKCNGRVCSSYSNEAGNNKSNRNSVSWCFQQDKLPVISHPTLVVLDETDQSSGPLPTDRNRVDMWRETAYSSNQNQVEPVVSSHIPSPHEFPNSFQVNNSLSHLVSSWKKTTNCFAQKQTSVHTSSPLNSSMTLSRNPQSSAQIHGILGQNGRDIGSSMINPCSEISISIQNGFYRSSSGSREMLACLPSVSSSNQEVEKFSKISSCVDLKFGKEINFNHALPKNPSNDANSLKDLEIFYERGKSDHNSGALSWLQAKPSRENAMIYRRKDSNSVDMDLMEASLNKFSKTEHVTNFSSVSTQKVSSGSTVHDCQAQETMKDEDTKKILGVPIFENSQACKGKSSSLILAAASSCSCVEVENAKNEGKLMIDINVACEPPLTESDKNIDLEDTGAENKVLTGAASFGGHFDLNSCMNEDEDPVDHSETTHANTNADTKISLEIDLEVPAIPEGEDDALPGEEMKKSQDCIQLQQNKTEQPDDGFIRNAAEAIVAISSSGQNDLTQNKNSSCQPPDASLPDPLLWFVEVISSCADREKNAKGSTGISARVATETSEEIDLFEAMTLQLIESKEEDYMPKPFVPEIPKAEEAGSNSLSKRTRRGPDRRGRQRRDFQRDILPGLASLSRHEVTEDLQTFGGIMRAAGCPWNVGRRNGSRNGAGRGRRRSVVDRNPPAVASPASTPSVQTSTSVELRLEDRSLTGWGKTTRRPRRQRYPQVNPPIPIS